MTWLASTPSAVVSALSAMIPRIAAHESETRAQEGAVARGIKPGYWIRQQLQEWKRDAAGTAIQRAPAARDLAKVGIGYKRVKKHGG